jgi:hypothetical protein
MAISVKAINSSSPKGPLRGQRHRTFVITGDASKPAGGYTILATDLGFTYLDFGVCGLAGAGAYSAGFQIGTASTDGTLQYFRVSATSTNAGTDIGTGLGASVTNITTNPVGLFVIGR